ncbi:MAG: ROK family protein [Clostridia bacterium]|nr:ROK family protein [Clostridia bacterium]
MYAIGIDIGGMSIKAGLVKDGKMVDCNRKTTAPTSDLAIEGIVEQINELLVKNSLSIKDIRGIGLGAPGLVSSESGVVEYCPNINWNKVPVVDILRKKFDTEIKLSNDANVAALGEARFGAGAKFNSSIMLTLGTGVGSGIIIDGKLFEGGESKGSELGHMVIKVGGEKCGCGRRGCLESYASATALIRITKNAMSEDEKSAMWQFVGGDIDKVDGRTAFECAKSGDGTANKVVDEYVSYLAEGIMNLANIFRPETFILGGGVSAQGKYLTDKLKAYCEKYEYGYKYAPKSDIVTATLGNDAGIIGAAALVL